MGYAELHCLSNFSFLRGASHPEELVERAVALGYEALAITDECSVAGAVRAHVAAKARGLRIIIGSEFRLVDGLRCVLLATDRQGYGQLCRLITRARRAAPKGQYRLEREDFAGKGGGDQGVGGSEEKRAVSDQRLADSKNPERPTQSASSLPANRYPLPPFLLPGSLAALGPPRSLGGRLARCDLSRPAVDRGRAAHHRA